MCITLASKIINTTGLLFDIAGATLVSFEVIKQFKGPKYKIDPSWTGAKFPPQDTDKYKGWEEAKYNRMKWGLGLLITGFCLQILSIWPQSIIEFFS